ncbi:MAG: FtsX-like permease family protein [bacterium]|nr:FtsX-like permease family protein [bacterium]
MSNGRKNIKPPHIANWLLNRMSIYVSKHSSEGDFEETYREIAEKKSVFMARVWYVSQIMRTLPEYLKLIILRGMMMYKSYFKIAIRNIRKSKAHTMINIGGFALGIASCILILLYVRYELSYDRFYENADNIYRVAMKRTYPDVVRLWGWNSPMLARTLERDYPEVLHGTRIMTDIRGTRIRYGDLQFNEHRVFYSENSFFDVFKIPFIHGDSETALNNPHSVVITKEISQKYFGDENPVGRTMLLTNNWNDDPFIIDGVIENIPDNSHIHFDFLVSLNSTRVIEWDGYSNGWMFFTYIVLQDGFDSDILELKLPQMVNNYFGAEIDNAGSESYEEHLAAGNKYEYFMQPLKEIHLRSNLEHEIEPNGNITYVYLFSFISMFILIIACINFMNLSTARSINRAREVGIRKAVGSLRKQLISQYLFESTLLSFISLLLAIIIVEVVLPVFNSFSGNPLNMDYFGNIIVIPGLIIFTLIIGILSGIYPAFFLSAFKPVAVLKGTAQFGFKGSILRNGLVVFQFVISIGLITGTFIVKNQVDFMLNKDLGYDKDHVMVINNAGLVGQQFDTFKQEVYKHSNIVTVSGSGNYPMSATHSAIYSITDSQGNRELSMHNCGVDPDFFKTFDMQFVWGRAFEKDLVSDSTAVVINESAVRTMGIELNDIGELILGGHRNMKITGVLKDFHFRSLHNNIGPVLFARNLTHIRYMAVRIRPDNVNESVSFIKEVWDSFTGTAPFEYSFLDQNLEQLYDPERKTGILSTVFSLMAIIIGCLGLFGLAAFNAEQKTKEIGIRKVLGASLVKIMVFLTKEFTRLITIAFILAVPLTYLLMGKWLENFAFRVGISLGMFLVSGLVTLLIALVTVSYHVLKAAFRNPTDSLRHE